MSNSNTQSAKAGRFTGTAGQFMASMREKPARSTATARTKQRNEVLAAQREVLSACILDIKARLRETPAWAHGYESAITAIELRLAALANK